MIPVQVGTRIAFLVDPARASSMARGVNVRAVRARRTKAIVRLIITPRELGDGRVNESSHSQSSTKSTRIERLFVDHEPPETMLLSDGSRVPRPKNTTFGSFSIYQHKPSSLFSGSSNNSRKRAGRGVPPPPRLRPLAGGMKEGE